MTRARATAGIVGLAAWSALTLTLLARDTGPATAYDRCVEAANTPGETGFATEVCDPLTAGYVEPGCVTYEDGSVECSRVWDPDTRQWRQKVGWSRYGDEPCPGCIKRWWP